MRITQARTTAKKVLTLNDIKGVDLSSAPLSVKPTRASYMKNMICKGGVNHKRNGFVQAAQFLDIEGNGAKINGIYPLSKGEHFAVHAGSELIYYNDDSAYDGDSLSDGVELADEKSQGFYTNGVLYLVSGTHLYYYDTKEDDGLLSLFDNGKAYVPTTSIGMTDKEHGSLLEPFEEVNLFSTKRINKLMGQRNEVLTGTGNKDDEGKYTVSEYSHGSSATFYLDGKIDFSKSVTVTADVYIANQYGENYGEKWTMPLTAFWDGDSKVTSNCAVNTVFEFSGEGTVTGISAIAGMTEKVEAFVEDSSSNTVYKGFQCTIGNIGERGVITFTPALPSPMLGEDNITVEYSVAKEEPKIKCACEMTIAAYNKQLAIVTEDDMVYYSSPAHGWGYFPDKSYIKSIDNVTAVFDGDGSLVVTSRHESAVISFNIRESDGLVVVPRVNAIYSDVGSISPYASVNLEGDTLVLTRKGVFGIGPRGVYIRSSAINKELLKFSEKDFEQAVACEHDARYYLFIGGVVYIADARYKVKFHEGERLASSFQYEWWRWELGVPISVLCHNDKMYIGRDDGRVLRLSDGYVDREVLELKKDKGDLFENGEYTFDGENLVLNNEIKTDGAYIELKNFWKNMPGVKNGFISSIDKDGCRVTIKYDDESFEKLISNELLYNGCLIELTLLDTESKYSLQVFTLDSLNCSVHIITSSFDMETLSVCVGRGVSICPYVEKEIFTLSSVDDSYNLIDIYGEKTTLSEFETMTAKLTYDKPVECELHSAVLNLGSDIKEKVLHELCFVPSIDTTGVVQLGFETNKNGALEDVGSFGGIGIVSTPSVSGELDVGALDFNNFTHDTSFARTFKKRLHERGVEFVKFKLASKTADDFSIERLSCIYSYYTR